MGAELALRQDVIIRGANRDDGIDLFAAALVNTVRGLKGGTVTTHQGQRGKSKEERAASAAGHSMVLIFMNLQLGTAEVSAMRKDTPNPAKSSPQIDSVGISRSTARTTILQAIKNGERIYLRVLAHPAGVSGAVRFTLPFRLYYSPAAPL